VLVEPVTRAPALAPKETGGSPEFPDYPSEHMPRSQIPVVSHPAGLGAGRTAAFQSLQLSALGSGCPDLSSVHHYTFFGIQFRGLRPRLCFAHRLSTIALRFGYRPGG